MPDLPGCFSVGDTFDEALAAVVDVDVARFDGRAEKIKITVPRNLLARIDAYARSHGATRSGFLADAARLAMR